MFASAFRDNAPIADSSLSSLSGLGLGTAFPIPAFLRVRT